MAPIKFEENIREKLQERELQPSEEAWTQLASKLGADLPEKKGNRMLWMAVAASVAGILLTITFIFTSEEKVQPTQIVIEQTTLPELDERVSNDAAPDTEKQNLALEEDLPESRIKEGANASDSDHIKLPEKEVAVAVVPKSQPKSLPEEGIILQEKGKLPIMHKEASGVAINLEKLPGNTEGFIDAKVEEVVASIQNIQKNSATVTAKEVDELLVKAQRDIATHRILNSGRQKIDATALLQDVETELERSFRNKVFDALGTGFNKVRTAVVERNN